MNKIKRLKQITPVEKKYLISVMGEVDARRKYRWGIGIFEKYKSEYELDDRLEYQLGLLYDHLVIFYTKNIKDPRRRNILTRRYLGEAEKIYRTLIKRNPQNLFGWYGLGRVYEIRGDYNEAIKHKLKAYRLLQKLPKERRGVLAMGSVFQQKGDYENAEKWYKKELSDLGENDFGANANLMTFYLQRKQCNKALPYALRVEKLLDKEFRKPAYKKAGSKNKTFVLLKKRIDTVKGCVK